MHLEAAVLIRNYLHVATVAIFYYDYLLTFPAEVEVVWKRLRASGSWWFLLNRYLAFFGTAIVTTFNFIHLTPANCKRYHLLRQALLVLTIVIVAAILTIRVYALYGRDKRVLWFLTVTATSLFALSCWSLTRQHDIVMYQSMYGSCQVETSLAEAYSIVIAWYTLFAFDILLFIFIAARAIYLSPTSTHRPRGHLTWTWLMQEAGNLNIIGIVCRDGALYFAIMAFMNLANVITFYAAEPLLKGVLSTPSSAIASTLCARIMLNLHESGGSAAAQRLPSRSVGGGTGETTADPGGAFTSHFEIDGEPQIDESRSMPATASHGWRWSEHTLRWSRGTHLRSKKSSAAWSAQSGSREHGKTREAEEGWEMGELAGRDIHTRT